MGNHQEIKYDYTMKNTIKEETLKSEDFQGAKVLWLDANVNIGENLKYQNLFKDINKIQIFPFVEINSCIDKIKEIRYEKTFIIISGSLLNDFKKEFEKIIKEIEIIPEIIIFTSCRRLLTIKQYILNSNFPLLDFNSVFFNFGPVKERLKLKNLYIPTKKELIMNKNDAAFFFDYIGEIDELTLPLSFTDYIEYPTKKDISNFNKFLLDKFSENKEFKLLMQQLILNIKIPCEILIKYYLRAYTLNSSFYKEMNYCLDKKSGEDYETYVKVVYHSLHLEYIKPAKEKKLFRGTVIGMKELEKIETAFQNKKEDLPACICYSKSFLSSTYEEEIAFKFMREKAKTKKENEEYVIYEIDKGTELDKHNASNSNIEKYSRYPGESEILFFPYSSFEITKLPKKDEKIIEGKSYPYNRIYLNYLGKYREKIKNRKILETNFAKTFFKTEIADKFEIAKNPEKLTFDVKTYIPLEKRKNSIIAVYTISNNDINKNINILNGTDSNKKTIQKLCNIYLNEQKIDFCFEYKFDKTGTYTFKFEFNDLLTNISKLFYDCKTLISLDFNNFKTNYLKDMSDMFNGCSLIQSLDLSNFKTKRVTNMKNMFYDCTSLKKLDISSFNTINVTDMSNMFCNCISLTDLDLSPDFKTKNVISMNRMFYNCKSLKLINLANFRTELVINMSEMFSLCSSLHTLDLSKFDTFNVNDMSKMFYNCSSLTSVNLNNFNTEKVNNMENMFTDCSSLTSLDLSSFDTKEVDNMNEMFKNCSSLNSLNLLKFNNNKVKHIENIFSQCKSLKTLIISKYFKIIGFKNNILEGINKEVKIKEDQKLNGSEIIDYLNESNNSIISSNTNKFIDNVILGNDDNNQGNSSINSVRSEDTLNILIKNGLFEEDKLFTIKKKN